MTSSVNPFMLKKCTHIIILTLISVIFLQTNSDAQSINVRDSTLGISTISINYGYFIPKNDMATRFGNSSIIGFNFTRKTKQNWIWGYDINYHFGNKLNESNILDSLRNERGRIISSSGNYADVRLFQRGISTYLKIGKLFPVIGPNKNSGILVTAGAGFLQHKIRIEVIDNNVPELNDDYKKGYDRLTNGVAFNEFIGYWHMSNNRLINFYVGADLTQSFTQSRRDFDFFSQTKDVQKRKDYLMGLKFGLILPLYKRMPKEFYFR